MKKLKHSQLLDDLIALPKELWRGNNFSQEDVNLIIFTVFNTKSDRVCRVLTSYGLKHQIEQLSQIFRKDGNYKYCVERFVVEAFEENNFICDHKYVDDTASLKLIVAGKLSELDPARGNVFFNISRKELNALTNLTSNWRSYSRLIQK